MPSEKPRITLYLSQELKSAVELWAKEEDRSVSSQIGRFLKRWLIDKLVYVVDPPDELRQHLSKQAKKKGISIDTLILSLLLESLKDKPLD